MNYEEQNNYIRDSINLLFIILFGILLLPVLIIVILFIWANNKLESKEDSMKENKLEEDREYVMPCGYKFKESELNKKLKKTKKKRNAKSN